ncbi:MULTISPECIES: hypothetical protein [Ruminococcus]|uniref:Uncharacterized protein n=1 Tax=Ruminococcus flavefaciens TaxID=1265 RepID=A0A1M7GM09_RUMFL|nr:MULTISPECIES: hypothetical protein [Ruminococcus]MCR4795863.1 hypothetical protein [Ruminococcus sp.]SHM17432.1 hypothetical protein SAMN04487860_101388 [Ruminococcus flavefaciens]
MILGKKISKALSFVISLTLALVICICSFEFSSNKIKANAAAAKIATLTIHSDPTGGHYGLPVGQHAFLSIRNKAGYDISVLGTNVPPNGAITIGTTKSLDGQGDGIYTNAEAWLIKNKGYYKKRVSLSIDITLGELFKLNDVMYKNNTWSWYLNCSIFARTVWNSVAPKSLELTGGTPVMLADSIKSKKTYKDAAKIGTCDKANVRRVKKANKYAKIDMKKVMKNA